jgi:hypothetical protein
MAQLIADYSDAGLYASNYVAFGEQNKMMDKL